MDSEENQPSVARGAEFRLPDGTIEVVFETAEGRVLTVREYPSREVFNRSMAEAEYHGTNPAIEKLPDVDAFSDR